MDGKRSNKMAGLNDLNFDLFTTLIVVFDGLTYHVRGHFAHLLVLYVKVYIILLRHNKLSQSGSINGDHLRLMDVTA